MNQHLLNNKEQVPEDQLIYTLIGNNRALWDKFFNMLNNNFKEFEKSWNYYNDGKCWLMKVTNKKKTIFWLTIINNTFKISFYFTDRAEEKIFSLDIPSALKEQFKNSKKMNKIRGLSIEFKNNNDIKHSKELIDLKLAIK